MNAEQLGSRCGMNGCSPGTLDEIVTPEAPRFNRVQLVHMIYRPSDSELPLLSNDVSAITKQKAIRLGPMRF